MVFEPNFTKVVSSVRKNLGITQSVIELKLPTNEDVIDAVYSVSAKSTIKSSEVAGNEINFVGLVDFQAMFESLGISALDYSAEFKDKYSSDTEILGEVVLSSNVVDVSSAIVSGGIKVVAIVEVTIDQIESKDISVLTKVNSDDVYLSTKQIEFSSYLGMAYEKFDLTQEFQVSDAKKVLMVTPSACVTTVTPKDSFVNVSGILNVDVCYQMGDNNSDIKSDFHSFDFSWDVALAGITDMSYIQSQLSIVFNEIKVSTMLEDDGAIINLYVPLVYTGYVFNKTTLDVVDDIYSKSNYMSITTENFETLVGSPSVQFKDSISGVASINETSPFIDEILGVCTNNIVLASSRVENGKLAIEGVANATVVYYTKETNGVTSVQVEMPFSVEEKVEGLNSSVVTLCLSDVCARSKRGKEIEVSGNLSVYSDMYGDNEIGVVSGVVLGEEKPHDDCVLYIYIVKPNQTIWDVAKEMSVSVDLILSQNPDVNLPLVGGEKLVIYNPNILNMWQKDSLVFILDSANFDLLNLFLCIQYIDKIIITIDTKYILNVNIYNNSYFDKLVHISIVYIYKTGQPLLHEKEWLWKNF